MITTTFLSWLWLLKKNLVSNISKEDACTEINNELSELSFGFSSDDSVADPNYCPLSEITDVAPIASTSTDSNYDFFPETILEREVAIESRVSRASRRNQSRRNVYKKVKKQDVPNAGSRISMF